MICRFCKKEDISLDHVCPKNNNLWNKTVRGGRYFSAKQKQIKRHILQLDKTEKCSECKWKNAVAIFRKKYLCKMCYDKKRLKEIKPYKKPLTLEEKKAKACEYSRQQRERNKQTMESLSK